MHTSLADRRNNIIHQIKQIHSARRGQLSEQFYDRENANGKQVRTGPYYVWQRYVNGKKRSVRIKPDQIERIRNDIKQGKNLQTLVEQLWEIIEQSAECHDADSKKKRFKMRG